MDALTPSAPSPRRPAHRAPDPAPGRPDPDRRDVDPGPRHPTHRGRRVVAGALLALVGVAAAVVVAFWWWVLRPDSPPPPTLTACEGGPVSTVAPDEGASLDGSWQAVAGPGRYVGYRIGERYGGGAVTRDLVVRTEVVTASMTVAGDQLTEVTVVADLTAMGLGDTPASSRDRSLATEVLETDRFPEARFVLDRPTPVAAPPVGTCVALRLEGQLTLHGVTRPLSLPLEVVREGDALVIAGSVPLVLADHGIETPGLGALAEAAGQGDLELLLHFERLRPGG